jgi:hypothetical protein
LSAATVVVTTSARDSCTTFCSGFVYGEIGGEAYARGTGGDSNVVGSGFSEEKDEKGVLEFGIVIGELKESIRLDSGGERREATERRSLFVRCGVSMVRLSEDRVG